jgi:hypothetical protein
MYFIFTMAEGLSFSVYGGSDQGRCKYERQ